MKTIILAFLFSLNLFAGTTCEEKIVGIVLEELTQKRMMLARETEPSLEYLGDGMFEVITPAVSLCTPEEAMTDVTWEVAIDAGCNIIYADIVSP